MREIEQTASLCHNLCVLRIPDIHDFISDMVLSHAKNKAVSLKVANTLMSIFPPYVKIGFEKCGIHGSQLLPHFFKI